MAKAFAKISLVSVNLELSKDEVIAILEALEYKRGHSGNGIKGHDLSIYLELKKVIVGDEQDG